jgi:hypothetical protein
MAVNVRLIDPFGNSVTRSLRKISFRHGDLGWFRTAPGTFKGSGDAFDVQQIDLEIMREIVRVGLPMA